MHFKLWDETNTSRTMQIKIYTKVEKGNNSKTHTNEKFSRRIKINKEKICKKCLQIGHKS